MTASVSPDKEGSQNVLADRVAIVTGSGRGIGKAIATVLAEHGAKIVISDMNVETSDATAEEMSESRFSGSQLPSQRHQFRKHREDGGSGDGEVRAKSTFWSTTPASLATICL